jgi:uncharacterized protein GlcG (DUF336 family)
MIRNKIQQLFDAIGELVPVYMQNPEDSVLSNGNVAVCAIDEAGNVYGKMYGTDKLESRRIYKIAWTKASQVWITGIATNEYERMVFNNEIDESIFGIETPDLIGWLGGQPIVLKDGTKLAVGFSGFRGTVDLEIVVKAVENLNL